MKVNYISPCPQSQFLEESQIITLRLEVSKWQNFLYNSWLNYMIQQFFSVISKLFWVWFVYPQPTCKQLVCLLWLRFHTTLLHRSLCDFPLERIHQQSESCKINSLLLPSTPNTKCNSCTPIWYFSNLFNFFLSSTLTLLGNFWDKRNGKGDEEKDCSIHEIVDMVAMVLTITRTKQPCLNYR